MGRTEEDDLRWQALVHAKLLQRAGFPFYEATEDESAPLLGLKPGVMVDVFTLARVGTMEAAKGLGAKAGFKRPRPQRTNSINWLCRRLALKMLPSEIANSEGNPESERNVRNLLARDARLMGLKLPRGWPTGRKKDNGGRMLSQ